MNKGLAGFLALAAVIGMALAMYGPVAQPGTYHDFADTRRCFALPNCSNVLTSLAFTLAGVYGLWVARAAHLPARSAWRSVFAGAVLTGAGSAYYHLAPTDGTLLWDRLGMALAFGAYLAALLVEFAEARREALLTALFTSVAVAAVAYWYATGDLRGWAWTQALAIVATPVVILLGKPHVRGATWLWAVVAAYLLAKGAEVADSAVYAATFGVLSGHALKHLLAAAGILFFAVRLARLPRQQPGTLFQDCAPPSRSSAATRTSH